MTRTEHRQRRPYRNERSPSRVVAMSILPFLLFALVDGPRLADAANQTLQEQHLERLRRGHRAGGASELLTVALDRLDDELAQAIDRPSAMSAQRVALLETRCRGLLTRAGDELYARRQSLVDRGVPDKALARHDAFMRRFDERRIEAERALRDVARVTSELTPTSLRTAATTLATGRHHLRAARDRLTATRHDTSHARPRLDFPWTAGATAERVDASDRALSEKRTAQRSSCSPELCPTEEVVLSDEARALASQLGHHPSAIAGWVRNHIDFEPYVGSLKTSQQVLATRSGNATDIASLLLALLRASEVESRYVRGTVTLPAATAASWLGTDDGTSAARLLNATGIAASVEPATGALSFEHTWVEARVPYFAGRGVPAPIDAVDTGLVWVGIDAAIKRYTTQPGSDPLADISAHPDALLDAVRNAPSTIIDTVGPFVTGLPEVDVLVPQLASWGAATRAHLERNHRTVDAAFGVRRLVAEADSYLPLAPPFAPFETLTRATSLDSDDRVALTLRIVDPSSGQVLAELQATAAAALNEPLILSWPPATPDDAATVVAVRDDSPFPAYLIDVAPRFEIAGQSPIIGTVIPFGWPLSLEVVVTGPGLPGQTTTAPILAGSTSTWLVAAGRLRSEATGARLGALRTVAADPLASTVATALGEGLASLAAAYLEEEERLHALVEGATGTHLSRQLTLLRAGYEPAVTELFDAPFQAVPGHITLNLDRRTAEALSRSGDADDERVARLTTGIVTGSLAHQALEQIFDGRGVSGARVVQRGNNSGVEIYALEPGRGGDVAALLDFDVETEQILADLSNAGTRLYAPQREVTIAGVATPQAAFVAVDPTTGRAHTALLTGGAMATRAVDAGDDLPTVADTLVLGTDAERYRNLLTPIEDWINDADPATEEVAYALVPATAAIKTWLADGGDGDPATFLTALLAVTGALESLTASPRVTQLVASPRVFHPTTTTTLHVAADGIFADAWDVAIYLDGQATAVYNDTVNGETLSFDWTDAPQHPDGAYRVEVAARSGNNTSPPSTATFSIDREPPTALITAPFGGQEFHDNDARFVSISGSAYDAHFDRYSVEIHYPGDPAGTFRELRSASREVDGGALALFVGRDAPSGTYQVQLRATDQAGNESLTPAVTFVTDHSWDDFDPPVVTVTVPGGSQQGLVTIVVDMTDDSTITAAELWLDGERIASENAPPSSWSIPLKSWSLTNGSHTIVAKATDEHGHTGTSNTATLTTDNYISELRAAPATFHQGQQQTEITARLAAATDWHAQVRGTSLERTGTGQQQSVYWQLDASSLDDADYIIDVSSNGHQAEVDITLISQNQVPTVALTAPGNGAVVRAPVDIVGTVDDDPDGLNWTVKVQRSGETDWETLVSGDQPRTEAVLTRLDPTLLRNGLYRVRLTATEDGVAGEQIDEIELRVDGELKVGHFTVSMQDVAVNVGGIPVTVVRTYDSRDKVGGEFGPGWRLELRSAELEVSDCRDVAMTLPDGRRTTFGFFPRRLANGMYRAEYHSITGVHDSLAPIGNVDLIEIGPGEYLDWDGNEYCPEDWQLTTVDGTGFTYAGGKLSQVVDRSGNTLSFSEDNDGIYVTSSMGASLTLGRTAGGPVEYVRQQPWPDIPDITYDYDDGLLQSVTDRNAQPTTFVYYPESMRIDHIDAPGGVPLIRNFYDDDGRLFKHIDADEFEILYDHDIDGRQEVVVDRNGHPTVYVYDDRGLVTAVTDPRGKTTRYEYDPAGNQTAVVDALGNRSEYEYDDKGRVTLVRDALGNETETTYDSFGNVLTATDALDRVTINTFDDAGRLLTTTNTLGEVVSDNTYDPQSGQLQTSKDDLGNITTYVYDALGRRERTIYADGSETRSAYDPKGNLEWESYRMTPSEIALWGDEQAHPNRNQVATLYTYDDGGRLRTTTSPLPLVGEDPVVTETTYTALGQVEDSIDGRGITTHNVYDQQGRLEEVYRAYGITDLEVSTSFGYDPNGQRVTETDEQDRVTTSVYDDAGRLVRTTYPDTTFTTTTYDDAGRVRETRDRKGNLTRFEYDFLGRQVAVIDATNRRTESEYDEVGNLALTRDPAGRETRYFYDALNRRIRTEYADGTTTRTEYDDHVYSDPHCGCSLKGRIQREIDQLNRTTAFHYDVAGRLIEVHQWNEGNELVTRYEYDVRGNRTAQVDALGRRTEFVYDALDRMRVKSYPLVDPQEPNTELYTYDLNGNLLTKTLPSGDTIIHEYDELNRLETKTYDPGSVTWTITYTPSGQRQTVDRDGTDLWVWTYEPQTGRLATFTDPASRTLTYGYDNNGNRTSLHSSGTNATTTFDYDALNRLTHVHDRNGQTTAYTYDPLKGVLGQVDHANSTTTHYVYDELDRVESIQHLGDGTTIAQFDYTLEANGRRDEIIETIAGVTTEVHYGYDDLDRLVLESRAVAPSNPSSPLQYDIEFEYDAVGNRRKQTRDAVDIHYAYDDRDRLQCEDDDQLPPLATACGTTPTLSYIWDENGRLTEKGTESYDWDLEDRMLSHNSGATTFAYDIDGIRYSKTQGASTTEFLVDANRTYQEVLEEWTDPDGAGPDPFAIEREYVHGMGLLWQKDYGTTDKSFFHGDAQMSTRLLTSAAGAVQSPFTYEAFGTDVGLSGQAATPYRYTAQQWDNATGLYYLRARYMDAQDGRFLAIDAYPGRKAEPPTLHAYAYVANAPTRYADPSGLSFGADLGSLMTSVTVQMTILASRTGAAFATGGVVLGRLLQAYGKLAEQAAYSVFTLFPQMVVQQGYAVNGKVLDFLIRVGTSQALVEVKYSLPRSGPALTRLVQQVGAATSWGQAQVVVWTLRTPLPSQMNAVSGALGAQANQVQFVHGVSGLSSWVRLYFGL